jgi:hypothetical protein
LQKKKSATKSMAKPWYPATGFFAVIQTNEWYQRSDWTKRDGREFRRPVQRQCLYLETADRMSARLFIAALNGTSTFDAEERLIAAVKLTSNSALKA